MLKSKWKSSFVNDKILNIILINKKNTNTVSLKTSSRSSLIIKELINANLLIYNGIAFKEVNIKTNMLNYKLGQFHFTRKQPKHKDKKK